MNDPKTLASLAAVELNSLRERVVALMAERDALRTDVESLNQMLHDTGYGQGQIDAYASQCEELDKVVAERDELKEANRTLTHQLSKCWKNAGNGVSRTKNSPS